MIKKLLLIFGMLVLLPAVLLAQGEATFRIDDPGEDVPAGSILAVEDRKSVV